MGSWGWVSGRVNVGCNRPNHVSVWWGMEGWLRLVSGWVGGLGTIHAPTAPTSCLSSVRRVGGDGVVVLKVVFIHYDVFDGLVIEGHDGCAMTL